MTINLQTCEHMCHGCYTVKPKPWKVTVMCYKQWQFVQWNVVPVVGRSGGEWEFCASAMASKTAQNTPHDSKAQKVTFFSFLVRLQTCSTLFWKLYQHDNQSSYNGFWTLLREFSFNFTAQYTNHTLHFRNKSIIFKHSIRVSNHEIAHSFVYRPTIEVRVCIVYATHWIPQFRSSPLKINRSSLLIC